MTYRFINREPELDYLNRAYDQDRSSLVIIYGRRRIGKTTLIKEFLRNKSALYLIATEEPENENKKNFQAALGDFAGNPLLQKGLILEWEEIFSIFRDHQPDQKKILVIDEFQYLGKGNKAFPSVFQKIWDEMFADANVMMILCGSLVSMMVRQTLSYASPIYGRRTGQLRMKQVMYKDYKAFFENPDHLNLIEYYSVTGGVPKYIEMFEPMPDIFRAIEQNILSRQSFLYEEPVFLLEKEVGDIGTYFSIIKSIAAGNHKIGRIASDLGIKQSGVTKYLRTLIELDILERIVPVTETNPEKSKKGLYVIKDNFIRFWFRFVYPFRNYLEMENTQFVLEKLKKNFVDNHVGFVFEDICMEQTVDISSKGGLDFPVSKVGKWWDKDTEIDLAALSFDGEDMLLGECKYIRKKVDVNVYHNLKKKSEKVKFSSTARYHYAIFSNSGFTPALQDLSAKEDRLYLFQV